MHPDHTHLYLTSMLSMRNSFPIFQMLHSACALGTDVCTENARQEMMRTLSIHVRNWCECSAYASGTGEGTEHTYVPGTNACTERSPSWAYASGTDAQPEHMHQFLTHMLSISLKNQNFKRFLQNMLRIRVRNWCVHWASASGTAVHSQHAHQKLNYAKLPQTFK
jgi:hypothetical protein